MALRRGGRPVNEGSLENGRGIVCLEDSEAVRNRAAVTIAVDPRQPRENVVGGMGDQRSVVIAADDASSLQEIQQVRHLFEVGRNIRIVAAKVHVVENNVDHSRDFSARRMQLACRRCGLRTDKKTERHCDRRTQ
jgi:hypothetical protein